MVSLRVEKVVNFFKENKGKMFTYSQLPQRIRLKTHSWKYPYDGTLEAFEMIACEYSTLLSEIYKKGLLQRVPIDKDCWHGYYYFYIEK